MGLDMYLEGEKYIWSANDDRLQEDGFPLKKKCLELAYWRKHPDLHGFIVEKFARGLDECQRIDLDAENLRTIAAALRGESLPHTTGFFFGKSSWHKDEVEENAQKFERAAAWVEASDKAAARDVYYRASW